MDDDGYRINVSFPDDLPNFGALLILPKNSTVKELTGAITKKVRKLFKRAFKCTYVTNDNGCVLDPEFTLFSALKAEDSVSAYAVKLKEAQNGVRAKPASLKRSADTSAETDSAADSSTPAPAPPPPGPEIKTKKTKRRKKDPDAPKRPMSSYLLFQESKRPEMVAKGHKGKEILQQVGLLWGAMSESDKEPWVSKQANLNTEYQAKMAAYTAAKGAAGEVPPPPPVMGDDKKSKAKDAAKKNKFDYKTFRRIAIKSKDAKAKGILKQILSDYNSEKSDDKGAAWLQEKLKSDKMIEFVKSNFNKDQQAAILGN